jgi:hypothetical protein
LPPIILILLALPVAAVLLVVLFHRSRTLATLVPALVLSGITGALLTAVFAFMLSTVPIAPYKLSSSAWIPILSQCLLSVYIGFGIGVLLAAFIGTPYWYIARRARPKPPPAVDSEA